MSKAALKAKISQRLLKKKTRRRTSFGARKNCRFCSHRDQRLALNYKNSLLLRSFITDRGKILPSRISGTCCGHQRELSLEIKKARIMALIPYTAAQI